MGLDITAYRRLIKLDVVFDSTGEPIDPQTRQCVEKYLRVYINPDFPGRADELGHGGIYAYAECERVLSMSYGSYSHWRERLARLVGYSLAEYFNGATGPFSELINFSDCEGIIGATVCAKLARDFAEFDERAAEVADFPDFYRAYAKLRVGVEMAADGGALQFH